MMDRDLSSREREALNYVQASMGLSGMDLTEEDMDELIKLIKADLSEEEFHEYLKRKIEEFKDNRH